SGVSQVLRGDEPMGLVRAFLYAGAQSVLVTLWQVEDTSARLLMERFYRALLAGGMTADPASALHQAQRELRELTRAELGAVLDGWSSNTSEHPFADPVYWAAYIVVGAAPASTSI